MTKPTGPDPATIQSMTMAGLNLIKQAISVYDDQLRLVVANAQFRDMFEIPDELMKPGASFEETIRVIAQRGEYGEIDDVEQLVTERVERALAFEPHYMERERTDGRWISVEGSPLPQGGWVAVYTDITATKRQEALLRARSEELSETLIKYSEDLASTNRELESTVLALEEAKRSVTESEARIRLTTEMMPAHIAHIGPGERYTYSNRRLSAVLPGRPRNILGLKISEALGEIAYGKLQPHLAKAFAGRASVFEFTDQESERRIRVALTPDSSPEPDRGVYILSMDITEETQTRAVLQQTRRRELAAQMTNGLAHDFSNLLTIILGTQSKLAKLALPETADLLVETTLGAARRGGALLDRIADMTGQRATKLEPVVIKDLLANFRALAGPVLPQDVELTVANATPDDPMLIDAGMVQDSLLNLVLNARDASGGKGGVLLKADIVRDTWLRFEVADHGQGFSEDALQRAFDPFFTTKGDAGTGLGLPMVFDSVKLMGGDVKIENTQAGASVVIRLPLRWAGKTSRSGLALLVEDNVALRDTIRDMLMAQGHTVIEAASADEAAALLSQVPDISFVLSDIVLEGEKTGIDLARSVDAKLPCFLMTSLPSTDIRYGDAAAVAPILTKPFSSETLVTFLSQR